MSRAPTPPRHCHKVAAEILGGPDGRVEFLNLGMHECLAEIDDLCRAAGTELHSRQLIAMFIFAWRNANPLAKPYA